MREFFIVANSFAAPFCSDTSTKHVNAKDAAAALEAFAKSYSHPCGLFAASCFANADAYHKGAKPLGRWKSNRLLAEEKATAGKGAYSMRGNGPGEFEVDGVMMNVKNPKAGRVVLEG